MEPADQLPSDDAQPAASAVSVAQGPSDPITTTSTSSSSTARSYDCAFCKRGFSNAQALGGHMNIHRKDRAKLTKQPGPSHAHFPFDIASPQITSSLYPIFNHPWISTPTTTSSSPSCPRQLPLFVEAPSTSSHRDDGPSACDIEQGGAELDLELRLGPERPEGPTAMGQKEFV